MNFGECYYGVVPSNGNRSDTTDGKLLLNTCSGAEVNGKKPVMKSSILFNPLNANNITIKCRSIAVVLLSI